MAEKLVKNILLIEKLVLYKFLIKSTKNLRDFAFSETLLEKQTDYAIQKEIKLLKLSRVDYFSFLQYEIQYYVKKEFQKTTSKQNDVLRFLQGIEIEKEIRKCTKEFEMAIKFYKLLFWYRKLMLAEQQWKFEFFNLKSKCNGKASGLRSKSPGYVPMTEKTLLKHKEIRDLRAFKTLEWSQQNDILKLQLKKSVRRANDFLKRKLKKDQIFGVVPLPHTLPYTDIQVRQDLRNLVNSKYFFDGSTLSKATYQAYDMDYVNSIIKPSIEHVVNEKRFNHLIDIINVQGPFKTKIKENFSSGVAVPYLLLPFKKVSERKELAIFIKKLKLYTLVNTIWNEPEKAQLIILNNDGSYPVKGGVGSYMVTYLHPKQFYLDLAYFEAVWDDLVFKELNKNTVGVSVFKSSLSQWTEFIDITTQYLKNELQNLNNEIRFLRSYRSPLLARAKSLQLSSNKIYDNNISNFKKIANLLKKNNFVLHSEIANQELDSRKFSEILSNSRVPRKFKGLPDKEIFALGKTLASYLLDHGQKSYRFGEFMHLKN